MINKKLTIKEIEINLNYPNDEPCPTENELKKIIDDRESTYHMPIESMDLNFEGDFVDVKCVFSPTPFERIRRITGYLVGNVERFNDAKRAEVNERKKHTLSSADKMRMRDTDADGRPDYIDSDGYTKTGDLYVKISTADYDRIAKRDKSLLKNCRQTSDSDFILQCSPEQKIDIDKILKSVKKQTLKAF